MPRLLHIPPLALPATALPAGAMPARAFAPITDIGRLHRRHG